MADDSIRIIELNQIGILKDNDALPIVDSSLISDPNNDTKKVTIQQLKTFIDSYTKSEIDNKLDLKADKTSVYAIAQVNVLLDNKANKIDIPTKVSDLENNSNFITQSEIDNHNVANNAHQDIRNLIGSMEIGTGNIEDFISIDTDNQIIKGSDDKLYVPKPTISDTTELAWANITGKPDIPVRISELENDSEYINREQLESYAQPIGEYLTSEDYENAGYDVDFSMLDNAINMHNNSNEAHQDIRSLISNMGDTINNQFTNVEGNINNIQQGLSANNIIVAELQASIPNIADLARHTIVNNVGNIMPPRNNLQFLGLSVRDDPDNDKTIIERMGEENGTSVVGDFVDRDEVLTLNNTIIYEPTDNYHPATKKYVDNSVKDISVPDTYILYLNYDSSAGLSDDERIIMTRLKPVTDVNIPVHIDGINVTSIKFIYTHNEIQPMTIYPLSEYLIDLFIGNMNVGVTYKFDTIQYKNNTIISKSTYTMASDTESIDKISILQKDNPLQNSIQVNNGEKIIFEINISKNTDTVKDIYIRSIVSKSIYSTFTSNPDKTSSELSVHFTHDDVITTTGEELRRLDGNISKKADLDDNGKVKLEQIPDELAIDVSDYVSNQSDNIIVLDENHKLYVQKPETTPVSISAEEDNQIQKKTDGLYVAPVILEDTKYYGGSTDAIHTSINGSNIILSELQLSKTEGNTLEIKNDGLHNSPIKISVESDNKVQILYDGLYVPDQKTPISDELYNQIESKPDGLYVAPIVIPKTIDDSTISVNYSWSSNKVNDITSDLRQKIQAVDGKSTILTPNDFGNPSDVTSEEFQNILTQYALDKTANETVLNHTLVKNLYDNHEWVYNELLLSWVSLGESDISIASNHALGVVMGTSDDGTQNTIGTVNVDGSTGKMTVNGLDRITPDFKLSDRLIKDLYIDDTQSDKNINVTLTKTNLNTSSGIETNSQLKIPYATYTRAGVMSATDKQKFDELLDVDMSRIIVNNIVANAICFDINKENHLDLYYSEESRPPDITLGSDGHLYWDVS